MFIREGTHFCFTKAEVTALLAHASADEMRPLVYSVGLFPSKGVAVATDGHRLAALASYDGEVCEEGADYIVPRFPLATAAKACPSKGIIAIHNGQITVYEDASTLPLPGMELAALQFHGPTDPYPPWESLVPSMHKPNPVAAIGFNAEYVASLAVVAKACENAECVLYVPEGVLDPTLFVMGEWRVIIMPIRHAATTAKAASNG